MRINDLYSLMLLHLDMAKGDRYHWRSQVKELQGDAVSQVIKDALGMISS